MFKMKRWVKFYNTLDRYEIEREMIRIRRMLTAHDRDAKIAFLAGLLNPVAIPEDLLMIRPGGIIRMRARQ